MARVLIVGGGCRGRRLAAELVGEGHAVRITSRAGAARAEIERVGAECWPGDPDRLATLRGALDGVTILAWLLGTASGSEELHTTRLEFFLHQAIDTTVRGFVFEAAGTAPALEQGEAIVRTLTERNAIPLELLSVDPTDGDAWLPAARDAVARLLG